MSYALEIKAAIMRQVFGVTAAATGLVIVG